MIWGGIFIFMSFVIFLLILDRMEMKAFYIFWRKYVVGVLEYMYSKNIYMWVFTLKICNSKKKKKEEEEAT